MKKFIIVVFSVFCLGLIPTTNVATSSPQAYLFSATNHERNIRQLHLLKYNTRLASIAQSHAQAEANCSCIFHDDAMLYKILATPGVRAVGENVGAGPSASDIHNAFMGSPEHKANILYPTFTDMGNGAVWKNGTVYVVEDFTQMAAATPARPRPRPKPTVRPRTQRYLPPPSVRPRQARRPAPSVMPSPTVPTPLPTLALREYPAPTFSPASPFLPPPLLVRPRITQKVSTWILVAIPLAFFLGLWACARFLHWFGWRRR